MEDTNKEALVVDSTISYSKRKLTPNKRLLNDPSTPSKTVETFYGDDLTEREGSLESLASLRSFESQVSADSSESHYSQENIASGLTNKPVPTTRTKRSEPNPLVTVNTNLITATRASATNKRTDSSSTGYSDGEIDNDTPNTVQSAPPMFTSSPVFPSTSNRYPNLSSIPSPNTEIWRRRAEFISSEFSDYNVPQKCTVTRSANVTQYQNIAETLLDQARHERLNEAANYNVKHDSNERFLRKESSSSREQRRLSDNPVTGDRLDSITNALSKIDRFGSNKDYLLRRQNSEGDTTGKLEMTIEDSTGKPSFTTCIISKDRDTLIKEKSEPDVPVRSARRNRPAREAQCKSMGESVADTNTNEARNSFLGTIKETNLNKSPNVWSRKHGSNEQTIRSAADWPSKGLESIHKVQQPGKRRANAVPTSELHRRNSDPATKVSGLSVDKSMGTDISPNDLKPPLGSDSLEWKGNLFIEAGHRFRKVARYSKDDVCVCCHDKMDAFVTQGYKCGDCKQLYHVKCIQNGGVLRMPCPSPHTSDRRKMRSRTPAFQAAKQAVVSKFSLTGTSAFSDSTDKIISDAKELALMQDFITKKIYKMEGQDEGRKPSEVDRVFKQALRKFKDELVITYSVAIQQGVEGNIKYTDLIANFLHVMETVCKQENTREDFPVTMGVNAFRGFMNEFMTLVKTEAPEKPSKSKRKKDKKRKQEEPIHHGNHTFQLTIINIPTACEVCTSFFMWPIERGLVCQSKHYSVTGLVLASHYSASRSKNIIFLPSNLVFCILLLSFKGPKRNTPSLQLLCSCSY